MLGQSKHGDHDGKVSFRSEGPMALETAMAWSFKRRGFTPSCRSCEPDTRPAAELRPSNAPLKVLRGLFEDTQYPFCMGLGPSNDAGKICAQKQCTYTIM